MNTYIVVEDTLHNQGLIQLGSYSLLLSGKLIRLFREIYKDNSGSNNLLLDTVNNLQDLAMRLVFHTA